MDSLTVEELKKIMKKHKVTGYSSMTKAQLVKKAKKLVTSKKKKGGQPHEYKPVDPDLIQKFIHEVVLKLPQEEKEKYLKEFLHLLKEYNKLHEMRKEITEHMEKGEHEGGSYILPSTQKEISKRITKMKKIYESLGEEGQKRAEKMLKSLKKFLS